jgi:hypothetical protein
VMLRYRGAQALGTLTLGEAWRVRPTAELLEQLEHLFGDRSVRLTYGVEKQSSPTAMVN